MDSTILTALLPKAKTALRISTSNTAFDDEISDILNAACADLEQTGGITMDDFYDSDNDTFDPLLLRAILTYARLQFGEPSDFERLERSYYVQKAQLTTCSGYGLEAD